MLHSSPRPPQQQRPLQPRNRPCSAWVRQIGSRNRWRRRKISENADTRTFSCLKILLKSGVLLSILQNTKKAAIHVDYVHRVLPCAQKLITNNHVLIGNSLFLCGAQLPWSLELTNPLIFQQLPSFSCQLHDKSILAITCIDCYRRCCGLYMYLQLLRLRTDVL